MVEKLDASMKQNTIIIDEVGDHIKDENGRKNTQSSLSKCGIMDILVLEYLQPIMRT